MFEKNSDVNVSISTLTFIRGFLVLLGFYLIWILRDIVLVVLTSIVIASFVEGVVPHFKKIKIGRVFGIVILYVFSLVLLSLLFYLFAPLLITEIYNFSVFISSYAPGIDFLDYFHNEAFSGAKDVVAKISGENLSLSNLIATSNAFITNLSEGFVSTLSSAFGGLFNVGLIIIVSFYLSVQEKGIENFLKIIVPLQYEDYALDLWNRSSKKIAFWVKGQMLLALIIFILTYLVLSLLGIQYAFLLAIVAGIMELVPYGMWIAIVPALAFAYLSKGLSGSVMVFGAYMIIHQFENFLFMPLITKKAIGFSPLIIILSILIGFELGGFWGVILSIPVTVVIMEFITDIEKRKNFSRINNEKK